MNKMTTQEIKTRRTEGHYEVEQIPYGRVYKWVPGRALVEEGLVGGKPLLRENEAYRLEHRAYKEWLREEQRLLYDTPRAS